MTTSFLEADVAGAYYDAQYNYRMVFSPIAMHLHLLAHYMTAEAAPIGRGFDKWWVFLSKAGVSTGILLLLAGVLLYPLAFCRECGQEYYLANLVRDGESAQLIPRSPLLNSFGDDEEGEAGYFALEQDGLWSEDEDLRELIKKEGLRSTLIGDLPPISDD